MKDSRQLSTTGIDEKAACCLLERAFAILSKRHGIKIDVTLFSDGRCCILTGDYELGCIFNAKASLFEYAYNSELFFNSPIACLSMLMTPGMVLVIHPIGSLHSCSIEFWKELGSSIDEVKVNLDLLEQLT